MNEFNKWMIKRFGYSWDEHEENLIKEGYSKADIIEELMGLTYVMSVLEVVNEDGKI